MMMWIKHLDKCLEMWYGEKNMSRIDAPSRKKELPEEWRPQKSKKQKHICNRTKKPHEFVLTEDVTYEGSWRKDGKLSRFITYRCKNCGKKELDILYEDLSKK